MPDFAKRFGRHPRSSVATLFPYICNNFTAAATAFAVVASCGSAHAQGAYDTSNPDYIERGDKMVSEGRIRKECPPVNAGKPDAKYVPIPEPSAELIAAAKKEGHFVLNSGISDQPSIEAYKAAFELRYPEIKLSVASGGTAALEERFLADHAAGNQQVDAEISNKQGWIKRAFEVKALQSLDKTIPGFFDHWPTGIWRWDTSAGSTAPAFYRVLGLGYNGDLVKGDLVPKDFKDLGNPAFKDQLLGMDIDYSATYVGVWKHIWDEVGDDGLRAIGKNLIKSPLYVDVQPLTQSLGAGGGMVAMQMGFNVANTMQMNGAPVIAVAPRRSTGTQYVFGIATDAPHPNAAKLFAHWLYSNEGQWVMSCAAFAGTAAYLGKGAEEFVPMQTATKEQIAKMKELLGL